MPRAAPGGDPLSDLVARIIEELGEDLGREGLVGTPARVADSMRFLTDGYGQEAADTVGEAIFEHDAQEMIVLRDLPFYSLCEHHLLPFFGTCHLGYLPRGRIVGLSKIPRLVDVYAHRLQLQERLTCEIAAALTAVIKPYGVGVVMEARHLCMEMRGVEKAGGLTVTSCMLGSFRGDARTRSEFLGLIGRR